MNSPWRMVTVAELTLMKERSDRLADALRELQIVAFDATVNSIPQHHPTMRQRLEHRCADARNALRDAGLPTA